MTLAFQLAVFALFLLYLYLFIIAFIESFSKGTFFDESLQNRK